MPTPGSGEISIWSVRAEIGNCGQLGMDWVRANTKDGQTSLGGIRNRAWYQRNVDGNCNNGNCNCGGNCGNIQCGQCFASQCINCANCDGRAWLQGNCNCACTYNCNANIWSYNCNCACDCVCGGNTCFPAGALVLMWDGTWRRIETIAEGELVMGADGRPTKCLEQYVNTLGPRRMYRFKEHPEHEWSDEHLYWARQSGKQWWWSASPDQWRWEVSIGAVVGLKDNYSIMSGPCEYAHLDGYVVRTPERIDYSSDTKVYLPITDGTPIIVNGYVVTGGTNQFQYDYETFDWRPERIAKKDNVA